MLLSPEHCLLSFLILSISFSIQINTIYSLPSASSGNHSERKMRNQTSKTEPIFLCSPFAITSALSFPGSLCNTSLQIVPALNRAAMPKSHTSLDIPVAKCFHQLWLHCVKYTYVFEGMEVIGREGEQQLKPVPFTICEHSVQYCYCLKKKIKVKEVKFLAPSPRSHL